MALELSEVIVPYKEFYGKNTERMPELIAEGRFPLSTAGIMERRLHSTLSAWKDNYFDSDDAIVYGPENKFKIVRGAQFLRTLNPQSILSSGALAIGNEAYAGIDGAEFSRKDNGLIFERDLTLAEVKSHPVWQALVGDQALLDEYAGRMFSEMKTRFGYDDAMGMYLASQPKVANARALYVLWLEGRSRLSGRLDLVVDDGRLVGVAPEAHSAKILKVNH